MQDDPLFKEIVCPEAPSGPVVPDGKGEGDLAGIDGKEKVLVIIRIEFVHDDCFFLQRKRIRLPDGGTLRLTADKRNSPESIFRYPSWFSIPHRGGYTL